MDRAQFTTATESQQKTELNRNAMKVVIINGSPRCKGFTSAILHSIESELTANKIDVRFVDLSKKNILHCAGCCSCYKTGHCHISDDADGLSDEIASADGLVIGSPTYASNVSGILKDFIDRGHFVIEQLLHKKYFFQAICHSVIFNFGIKPFVNKKGQLYQGVLNKWKSLEDYK